MDQINPSNIQNWPGTMAYQYNPSIGASSVVGGRASTLHQSSIKEQRKLEENLESLSKEMRSRMNRLDLESNEMRRHAVRMFDSVRRKEHQRMTQSRQEFDSLRAAGSSDSINHITPSPPSRANSAGRLKMTPSQRSVRKMSDDTSSQMELSRCYSSPASIDKLSPMGSLDMELATEPSSKGDFSDESIAADAASIPVTNMPNFCNGRELGMIGESTASDDNDVDDNGDDDNDDYSNDDGTVFEDQGARSSPSKSTPSPLQNGRRHTQSSLKVESTSQIGAPEERSKLLTRRRRTSEIVKPVSLTTVTAVRPSRRHSSYEPAFLLNTGTHGTRSSQELLLHRTSSVNLPPLYQSSAVGKRVSPDNQMMSPPLSPRESKRSISGARYNAPLRRASRTESSPCIMKQTFASTHRRSVSQVVGELVHIEEMRRQSRGASMQDDIRKARGAWQSNRSFPGGSSTHRDDGNSLSKTQSLGDIFDELKDCRYLRITNQDSTT